MKAIALDGPAGAGKSTMAKLLAKELGYIYVDTGALYRAIAYYALTRSADMHDEKAVTAMLAGTQIELRFVDREQRVFLNGVDVSGKIRTEAVSMAASAVSALPAVRAFLLQLQRDIAAKNDVVMDGRDIGTVVLPNADVKIFLTASVQERARRRYEELIAKGMTADYDEVLADMEKRDFDDSNRAVAPLKPAEDSVTVDTTGLDMEQSIERLKVVINGRV